MRDSTYDLNYLLYLQQVALMQADAASLDAERNIYLHIASTYEDEIFRRTDGRLRFGRPFMSSMPVPRSDPAPVLTLVAA